MYGVDVVLRAGQMSNTTLVTAASVDNESGVATLQFRSAQVRWQAAVIRSKSSC
jgi:hypothetical protein